MADAEPTEAEAAARLARGEAAFNAPQAALDVLQAHRQNLAVVAALELEPPDERAPWEADLAGAARAEELARRRRAAAPVVRPEAIAALENAVVAAQLARGEADPAALDVIQERRRTLAALRAAMRQDEQRARNEAADRAEEARYQPQADAAQLALEELVFNAEQAARDAIEQQRHNLAALLARAALGRPAVAEAAMADAAPDEAAAVAARRAAAVAAAARAEELARRRRAAARADAEAHATPEAAAAQLARGEAAFNAEPAALDVMQEHRRTLTALLAALRLEPDERARRAEAGVADAVWDQPQAAPGRFAVPADITELLRGLQLSQHGAALVDRLGVRSVADLSHVTDAVLHDALPELQSTGRDALIAAVEMAMWAAGVAAAPRAVAEAEEAQPDDAATRSRTSRHGSQSGG